ncbi:unnamed protein product [Prunus armeniaca]|uniref:Uncharacterized protein n=1 Tax=Prunus armeniaca TaxID=36596 RepID=A0A6J5W892_PRUAR|nr:unnamed protein product [Prunus armeniaca]
MADAATGKQNQDAARDYCHQRRRDHYKSKYRTKLIKPLIIFGIQLTKFLIKSMHESIHGGLQLRDTRIHGDLKRRDTVVHSLGLPWSHKRREQGFALV